VAKIAASFKSAQSCLKDGVIACQLLLPHPQLAAHLGIAIADPDIHLIPQKIFSVIAEKIEEPLCEFKHEAERWGEVNGMQGYIANGELIVAAGYLGFAMKWDWRGDDNNGPNVMIGVATPTPIEFESAGVQPKIVQSNVGVMGTQVLQKEAPAMSKYEAELRRRLASGEPVEAVEHRYLERVADDMLDWNESSVFEVQLMKEVFRKYRERQRRHLN
jgi:hypothetical protein